MGTLLPSRARDQLTVANGPTQRPASAAQWSLRKEETKAIFKKHMMPRGRRAYTFRSSAGDLKPNPKKEKPLGI